MLTLISRIPNLIPRIPIIATLIPRIPFIPTLIPQVPIILLFLFPDSLFQLLQIAELYIRYNFSLLSERIRLYI